MRSWKPRRPQRPPARRDRDRWTQHFAPHFPSWLRERGEQYLAAGDVVLEAVSDGHVRAMVLGAEPHIVELRRHAKRELVRALITEDHSLIGGLRREDLELLLS